MPTAGTEINQATAELSRAEKRAIAAEKFKGAAESATNEDEATAAIQELRSTFLDDKYYLLTEDTNINEIL